MAFKLKELDGDLGEILANLTSPKPMVLWIEKHGRYQVWLEPDFLHIEDLKVNIFSGEFHRYSRVTDDYEPDHDAFYFFNASTGRLVYSEYGSDLPVCVTNYIRESGKQVESVDDLLCTYALDNGKFIKKKVLTRDKL